MSKKFFKNLKKVSKSGQFFIIIKSENKDLIGLKAFKTDSEMILSNEDYKNDILDIISEIKLENKAKTYELSNSTVVFSEFISEKPTIILCGAGHISKCVHKYAITLGFDTVIIDDREEFANIENFQNANKIYCDDFSTSLRKIKIDNAYYIIVTRGHVHDGLCAKEILHKNYKYIGMIGSKRKVSIINNHLKELGFSDEKIAEINAPIGLKIGAETPEEIAISIIAEIISYRRKEKIESYINDEVIDFIAKTKEKVSFSMVLEKTGSIPRGAGSKMAVSQKGEIVGSIGGGAVEFEAINQCKKFENKTPCIYKYSMTNDDASREGMSCGGNALIYIENIV